MAQMRTRPTLPTRGDTGPSQHGRHPPPTLHHGSLRAPPEAPHSTRPTLPKSSPPRPAAGRKRGGARGRQRRRRRSPARAAAPPGRRSRSRTSWSSAGATARMQRRSELRPVSHTNAGAGGGPRGMATRAERASEAGGAACSPGIGRRWRTSSGGSARPPQRSCRLRRPIEVPERLGRAPELEHGSGTAPARPQDVRPSKWQFDYVFNRPQ